jgi:uncharacterized pyridoxal phosphate-containing UPF0001 family protein
MRADMPLRVQDHHRTANANQQCLPETLFLGKGQLCQQLLVAHVGHVQLSAVRATHQNTTYIETIDTHAPVVNLHRLTASTRGGEKVCLQVCVHVKVTKICLTCTQNQLLQANNVRPFSKVVQCGLLFMEGVGMPNRQRMFAVHSCKGSFTLCNRCM